MLVLAEFSGPDRLEAQVRLCANVNDGPDFTEGEFEIRSPYLQAKDDVFVDPEDIGAWQEVLDILDTGASAAWRKFERGLSLEFEAVDSRQEFNYWAVARSETYPFVIPRFAVLLDDEWFDRAYERVDVLLDRFS